MDPVYVVLSLVLLCACALRSTLHRFWLYMAYTDSREIGEEEQHTFVHPLKMHRFVLDVDFLLCDDTMMQVIHRLSSPNVLKFYDWYETRNNVWLILEFCTGGDLLTLIKQVRQHYGFADDAVNGTPAVSVDDGNLCVRDVCTYRSTEVRVISRTPPSVRKHPEYQSSFFWLGYIMVGVLLFPAVRDMETALPCMPCSTPSLVSSPQRCSAYTAVAVSMHV